VPESHEFDCEAGFVNWESGWSEVKMQWCCKHVGRACLTTTYTLPQPFDCEKDLESAQTTWESEKQEWCCSNRGKGCPAQAGVLTN